MLTTRVSFFSLKPNEFVEKVFRWVSVTVLVKKTLIKPYSWILFTFMLILFHAGYCLWIKDQLHVFHLSFTDSISGPTTVNKGHKCHKSLKKKKKKLKKQQMIVVYYAFMWINWGCFKSEYVRKSFKLHLFPATNSCRLQMQTLVMSLVWCLISWAWLWYCL